MKILITGVGGFIGFHLAKALLKKKHIVYGIDNISDYYDVNLKYDRLSCLGIDKKENIKLIKTPINSSISNNFIFQKLDITDEDNLDYLFQKERFDIVCHLAAQAGVRYGISNPKSYINSNIFGFYNILECCRRNSISHLIYASSSSIYGQSSDIPFKESSMTDKPVSLYAATKKSNELLAHSYSDMFGFSSTGLRFFTVYGPWGRPDMALHLFTEAITNGKPIKVFNNGKLERDFTYIDDIIFGIIQIIERGPTKKSKSSIYNIGRGKPIKLMDFIHEIESQLEKKSIKNFLPMQPGDVSKTWSNSDKLALDFSYSPRVDLNKGVEMFLEWFLEYYKKSN